MAHDLGEVERYRCNKEFSRPKDKAVNISSFKTGYSPQIAKSILSMPIKRCNCSTNLNLKIAVF